MKRGRPLDRKMAALLKVLRADRRPRTLRQILPPLERRVKQIIGRTELYSMLRRAMRWHGARKTGRGDDATYALASGRR